MKALAEVEHKIPVDGINQHTWILKPFSLPGRFAHSHWIVRSDEISR